MFHKLLNEWNREYRYICFTVGGDGELIGMYDVPLSITDECLGGVAFEMIIRMPQIVDDVYPEIMRAIWAS